MERPGSYDPADSPEITVNVNVVVFVEEVWYVAQTEPPWAVPARREAVQFPPPVPEYSSIESSWFTFWLWTQGLAVTVGAFVISGDEANLSSLFVFAICLPVLSILILPMSAPLALILVSIGHWTPILYRRLAPRLRSAKRQRGQKNQPRMGRGRQGQSPFP